MAAPSSSLSAGLSRIIKAAMVIVIVPLTIGLLQSFLKALDVPTAAGRTYRQLAVWGFTAYVGMHVLLYRPAGLFRISHRLFSTLAVWLFGGQVATVEAKAGGKGKRGKGEEGGGSDTRAVGEGSTLVAFSPYVIPLYVILASLSAWLLRHHIDPQWIDAPAGFLIGFLFAFHWLMTAEDLQQQRDRWHVETYLLAIGLVFALTLLIGGACLPLAVPGFSFVSALSDGLARTQAIYSILIESLFL
jgi:hypothetical protein